MLASLLINYLPTLQHVVHPEKSTATAFHSSSLSSVIVVVIVKKYKNDVAATTTSLSSAISRD